MDQEAVHNFIPSCRCSLMFSETWHQPYSPYSILSDTHTQHESYDLTMPPSSLSLGFCSFCLEHPSDEISVLNSHKFSNDNLTLLFLWETLPHHLSNITSQPLKPKIPLSASLVVCLLLAGATIKTSLFPSCPGK